MVVQGTSVVQVSRQSSLDQGVTRRVDATRRVMEASGVDRGLGPVGAIVQGDRVQAQGTAALVLAPVCAHSVGGCIRALVWRLVELVLGVESWAIWPNHVLDFPASSLFPQGSAASVARPVHWTAPSSSQAGAQYSGQQGRGYGGRAPGGRFGGRG